MLIDYHFLRFKRIGLSPAETGDSFYPLLPILCKTRCRDNISIKWHGSGSPFRALTLPSTAKYFIFTIKILWDIPFYIDIHEQRLWDFSDWWTGLNTWCHCPRSRAETTQVDSSLTIKKRLPPLLILSKVPFFLAGGTAMDSLWWPWHRQLGS